MDPETEEKRPSRILILTDLVTNKTYMFPMPEDSAVNFGRVLAADDPGQELHNIRTQMEAREQLKVDRQPSDEELRAMQQAATGKIPSR